MARVLLSPVTVDGHSKAPQRLSGWRRVANALWRAPSDPQIYGMLEFDARPISGALDRLRAAGVHATPTHVVGKALAYTLAKVPELNVRLLGGRAIPRETVDVFFITAVDGGHDLSGVKIRRADEKSLRLVGEELDARSREMKAGKDKDFSQTKHLTDALPMPALRAALHVTAWLVGDHDKSVKALSLAASPFGGGMVTSVGMLGIPMGFAPLAWMYTVPILVLVGEMADKPVAEDGKVVVRTVLPLTFTIDHRYVDGWHLGRAISAFREYMATPEAFDSELGAPR